MAFLFQVLAQQDSSQQKQSKQEAPFFWKMVHSAWNATKFVSSTAWGLAKEGSNLAWDYAIKPVGETAWKYGPITGSYNMAKDTWIEFSDGNKTAGATMAAATLVSIAADVTHVSSTGRIFKGGKGIQAPKTFGKMAVKGMSADEKALLEKGTTDLDKAGQVIREAKVQKKLEKAQAKKAAEAAQKERQSWIAKKMRELKQEGKLTSKDAFDIAKEQWKKTGKIKEAVQDVGNFMEEHTTGPWKGKGSWFTVTGNVNELRATILKKDLENGTIDIMVGDKTIKNVPAKSKLARFLIKAQNHSVFDPILTGAALTEATAYATGGAYLAGKLTLQGIGKITKAYAEDLIRHPQSTLSGVGSRVVGRGVAYEINRPSSKNSQEEQEGSTGSKSEQQNTAITLSAPSDTVKVGELIPLTLKGENPANQIGTATVDGKKLSDISTDKDGQVSVETKVAGPGMYEFTFQGVSIKVVVLPAEQGGSKSSLQSFLDSQPQNYLANTLQPMLDAKKITLGQLSSKLDSLDKAKFKSFKDMSSEEKAEAINYVVEYEFK